MKYLLDVNALVALGFAHHEFHDRMAVWMMAQKFPPLATCSITELGFARVLVQAPAYGFTIMQAQTLLVRLKKASSLSFTFIPDSHDISRLPPWVRTGKQTTDGHLAELAKANGAVLATLDEKRPEALPDSSKKSSLDFSPSGGAVTARLRSKQEEDARLAGFSLAVHGQPG